MRVIAGRHRGRTLVAPRGATTRPTGDRVREALFSILGPLEGLDVLDLFAGSGALAIEALSRGAASAVLVDRSASAVAAIRRNLESLGLEAEVIRGEALSHLGKATEAVRQYDLVFVDPPYRHATSLRGELSAALPPVVSAGGRVVCESDRRDPLGLGLPLVDQRTYGDTLIEIHRPHDHA